ncbi:MAG: DUF1684 domain-containing protein, partial [Saprospiraceae bacterium]|nr:DUF1684 domain-containing protein [Saprospiraceae bacterium]
LSLIGLHWIKEGKSTFGSDKNSDVILAEHLPEKLGQLNYFEGEMDFALDPSATPETHSDPFKLMQNNSLTNQVISYASFQAYLINRNGKFGLRMKDSLAETRLSFEGLKYFPYRDEFVVKAKVMEANTDTIMIENVLGMFTSTPVAANLQFDINGKTYDLIALDGGPDDYFVIFDDLTSGLQTYGGGRYIDVRKKKNAEGFVIIDFNRAYNPPCVFTDFATCPLPPEQNKLDVAVKAGELSSH